MGFSARRGGRLGRAASAAVACLLGCGAQPRAAIDDALRAVSMCTTCPPAAPSACPPGQAAFVGEPGCAPVGASCPGPLGPDPSGWGCEGTLPSAPCAGATRESVSARSCVPIGDCAAPFPPPGATLFVDDDGPQDATHFRTIAGAAAAAPAGAVIAVEAGIYPEAIVAPRARVTLAGRCAERVRITGTGGNQVAVYADGTRGIVVRGVTITGHAGAVFADFGELTLEDSVLEGNTAVGVFAKNSSEVTVRNTRISGTRYLPGGELGAGVVSNTGSRVTLEEVTLTGNDHRGASVGGAGSSLVLKRSVVARSRKVAGLTAPAAGVLAVESSLVSVSESALADNDGVNLYLERSNGAVLGSVLLGARGRLESAEGLGVFARAQATLYLNQTTVAEDPVIGLYVDGAGTTVDLAQVTLRGPVSQAGVQVGRGAQVASGGRLTGTSLAVIRTSSAGVAFQDASSGALDHVAIREVKEINWPNLTFPYGGFGVLCEERSQCDLRRLSVERATLSGISSTEGAVFTAEEVAVRDTQSSTTAGGGNAGQVANGARLAARHSYFGESRTTGFIVVQGGTLTLERSTLTGTRFASDGSFGHGVTVFRKGLVRLEDTLLSKHAGVALVADDAQAQLVGGEVEGNLVALHVQNGSFLTAADGAEALLPGELRVSSSTAFKDNQTRVGVGVVPLPTP